MSQNNIPEGDRIYDLYTGVYKPQIIRVALELDVFSLLKNSPAVAETVARDCQCEVEGIRRILDYLTSISVLVKCGDYYSLSPEAATFLVRGKKTYAGDLVMDFIGPNPWGSMKESIRTGQPKNFDLDIHFAQDAWIESYRNVRISSSLQMWAEVGIDPERIDHLSILDIACGCAIKTLVLAQKSSNVKLTCLDRPLVLEAARDLAERWGVTTQVQYVPGDLLTTDFGEELYDVCLLGQITHYLTVEQNCDLYRRICRALVPNGTLVLDVPMAMEGGDESSSFLSLILWANSGGRAYAFEEYRSWMLANGFKRINQLSARLLSAVR